MLTTTARRRLFVVLASGVVFCVVAVGSAVAAEGEAEFLNVSGWTALAALVAGTVVLAASVELLVRALVKTALRFRASPFLLAVVFSGFEFDNVAFGVFTGFRELQEVSFGLAIGNAISIFGLVLALGALTYPFDVDVPRDYLALTAVAPLVLVPFVATGEVTLLSGVVLLALGVAVFAYVYRRERAADRAIVRSDEVREMTTATDGQQTAPRYAPEFVRSLSRRAWFWPAMLAVALVGVVAGAETSSAGVEGMLDTWELGGTALGVTLVTVLYTLDDLLLVIEPLRLGYRDVAVGGVIGSLLFFVTANVGIVALVGTIQVNAATRFFHYPMLVGMTVLTVYFLWRGRLSRRHGTLLVGLYATYLLVNVYALSTLPVGG